MPPRRTLGRHSSYSGFTSTSYVSVFRSASERRSQPGLRIPYNTSGGKPSTSTTTATRIAYETLSKPVKPAGLTKVNTNAAAEATKPTPATNRIAGTRYVRRTSGWVLRRRIAAANINMYITRYSAVAISTSVAKAVLPLGINTNSNASTVTIMPCGIRMPSCTSWALRFCSAGGISPVRAAASKPREGPAIQATTEANAPSAMSSEITGVPQPMPKWSKNSLNARLMPSMSPSSRCGTAKAIAKVGSTSTSRISAVASAMARGN